MSLIQPGYNPSKNVKIAQIGFGAFFCLTCAGVVFGFAALKPVLAEEGIYADVCPEGTTGFCEEQDTKLNLLFTFAAFATNVAALPIGYTLDTIGPKKTSIVGAIVFALGNFFFGLGHVSTYFDSHLLGFILLALGGPLIFLPSFHLSNAFPAYSGIVLSLISGAFDTSSIPYVIYRQIYIATNGAFSLRIFFWGYMILPAMVIVEQIFLAPPVTYQRVAGAPAPTEPEIDAALMSSSFSRLHYGDAHDDEEEMVKVMEQKDRLTGTLYGMTAKEQIKTKWFWLFAAFTCIHMARINFYILSVWAQLDFFTGDAGLAESLTTLFTVLLPLGGVVGIPAVGILLDYRPYGDVVLVEGVMSFAMGILCMMSAVPAQIIGIVVFVLFRPLMYSAVSDGLAKVMGFQTFGRTYGTIMTMSGLFSLINAPLDILVKTKLNRNFIPVDVVLLVAGVVSTALLWYAIYKQTRPGAVALAV